MARRSVKIGSEIRKESRRENKVYLDKGFVANIRTMAKYNFVP